LVHLYFTTRKPLHLANMTGKDPCQYQAQYTTFMDISVPEVLKLGLYYVTADRSSKQIMILFLAINILHDRRQVPVLHFHMWTQPAPHGLLAGLQTPEKTGTLPSTDRLHAVYHGRIMLCLCTQFSHINKQTNGGQFAYDN
jgi:hypothetical protein